MPIQDAIDKVLVNIVNPVLALLFASAFLVFMWGIFQMILSADDEKKRATGKMHMFFGIIGLFIMVSAVGIVYIIQDTVGSF